MDPDFIRELFAAFERLSLSRMFFAIGIFADGMMFGYAVGGLIYLKTDDDDRGRFRSRPVGAVPIPDEGRHAHAEVVLAAARAAL